MLIAPDDGATVDIDERFDFFFLVKPATLTGVVPNALVLLCQFTEHLLDAVRELVQLETLRGIQSLHGGFFGCDLSRQFLAPYRLDSLRFRPSCNSVQVILFLCEMFPHCLADLCPEVHHWPTGKIHWVLGLDQSHNFLFNEWLLDCLSPTG